MNEPTRQEKATNKFVPCAHGTFTLFVLDCPIFVLLCRKRDELEKKRMDLEKGESGLRGDIKVADGQKTELSEEKYDLESKLDRQQQALEEKQIEYDQR